VEANQSALQVGRRERLISHGRSTNVLPYLMGESFNRDLRQRDPSPLLTLTLTPSSSQKNPIIRERLERERIRASNGTNLSDGITRGAPCKWADNTFPAGVSASEMRGGIPEGPHGQVTSLSERSSIGVGVDDGWRLDGKMLSDRNLIVLIARQ